MNKIYINLASHNDPLLYKTIESLKNNVSSETILTVSVFDQISKDDSDESKILTLVDDKFKIIYTRIDLKDVKGVSWARSQCSKFITNEDFVYQIDSHMAFIKNWDKVLISDYNMAKSKYNTDKIVITNATYNFDVDEAGNWMLENFGHPLRTEIKYFLYQHWDLPAAHSNRLVSDGNLYDAIHICAGNFFTNTEWFKNIGINEKLCWDGEEHALVLSSFKNDYKILHGSEIVCYHYIKSGNHTSKFYENPELTFQEKVNLNDTSLYAWQDMLKDIGTETLEKYKEYSGVDYINQIIEDRAYTNTINFPPDVDIKYPQDFKKQKEYELAKRKSEDA